MTSSPNQMNIRDIAATLLERGIITKAKFNEAQKIALQKR